MNMSTELKTECASVDAEFDRQFGDPGFALSAEARRHLARCERCRNLYDYLASPPALVSVSSELTDRVRATLKSSLKPVNPVGSTARIAIQLLLVFALLAASVASLMKTAGLQAMTRGQLAGITIALIIGAGLLSLSLASQMIPGSLQRVSAKTAMTILAAAFFLTIAVLFPWRAPEEFFTLGWHCLKLGTTIAIPAAVVFGIMVWRGAPLGLGTLGATLGAIAGLVSVTILQSNCDMQDAIHLLVWHGGVLVITTLTGFLIGRSASGLQHRSL